MDFFLFLKHDWLLPSIVKEKRQNSNNSVFLIGLLFQVISISLTDDLTIGGICLLRVIRRKVCQVARVTRSWLTYKITLILTLYSLSDFKLNSWNNPSTPSALHNISLETGKYNKRYNSAGEWNRLYDKHGLSSI